MKESSTYQMILAKGRAEGITRGIEKGKAIGEAQGKAVGKAEKAQRLLLLFGAGRLGKPSAEVERRVRAITEVERLKGMAQRIWKVESWKDLLA